MEPRTCATICEFCGASITLDHYFKNPPVSCCQSCVEAAVSARSAVKSHELCGQDMNRENWKMAGSLYHLIKESGPHYPANAINSHIQNIGLCE